MSEITGHSQCLRGKMQERKRAGRSIPKDVMLVAGREEKEAIQTLIQAPLGSREEERWGATHERMMGPQRIDFLGQDPTSSTVESRPRASIFGKEETRVVASLRDSLSQAAPHYPPVSLSFSPFPPVSLFCLLEVHRVTPTQPSARANYSVPDSFEQTSRGHFRVP